MDVKRSIMIKFTPTKTLDGLFDHFGSYVTHTLKHIEKIIEKYEKIDEEGKCSSCSKETHLTYKQTKKKDKNCQNCFMKEWSEYTLFKEYKDTLSTLPEEIFKPFTSQVIYYCVISAAVKIYKSFYSKKTQREEEKRKAQDQTITLRGKIQKVETSIKPLRKRARKGYMFYEQEKDKIAAMERDRLQLYKHLRPAERRAKRKMISFPHFRNNEVFLWQGMSQFKKENGSVYLYVTDPSKEKEKIRCSLQIGKYQENFIRQFMEKEMHKKVYPKIIRKKSRSKNQAGKQNKSEHDYYFILPHRDMVSVAKTRKEIEEYITKNQDIEFCCLSFGIKQPITATLFNADGSIKAVQRFGNGRLYQKKSQRRVVKAWLGKKIGAKYKHDHPHKEEDKVPHQKKRRAMKKISAKMAFKDARFVNYYNQNLTTQLVQFIRSNTTKPVIVIQETKNMKNLNYKGVRMRRLASWPLEQQKCFLEYKALLSEIPVAKVPYAKAKEELCGKCGHDNNRRTMTEKLDYTNRFKCDKCKYEKDYAVNDAINLHSSIHEVFGRNRSPPERAPLMMPVTALS